MAHSVTVDGVTFTLPGHRRQPADLNDQPPSLLAADGVTRLYRFDVEAVVYATDAEQALSKIDLDGGLGMYVEAARLKTNRD